MQHSNPEAQDVRPVRLGAATAASFLLRLAAEHGRAALPALGIVVHTHRQAGGPTLFAVESPLRGRATALTRAEADDALRDLLAPAA